jgi:hypothetical protein
LCREVACPYGHIETPESVRAAVAAHPYPLVFATVSGAHLYGFASADSDYEIRGVHVLPLVERMLPGPPELDLVMHDAEKFFRMLLKPNGYVLDNCFRLLFSRPRRRTRK